MEYLCHQYWYPLYSFIRRHGRTHHEAEDCTQEFFARLLASEGVGDARPERGRFRTFLLAALKHFLINEWHRAHTAKRGGGQVHLALEFETAEGRYLREPVDPALTPEQAFDHNWAVGLFDKALDELRTEYSSSGRGDLFAALAPIILRDSQTEPYAVTAQRIGMTVNAFTVALQRLRRRLGERMRLMVAETVANESEVDAELRHLIATIGRGS